MIKNIVYHILFKEQGTTENVDIKICPTVLPIDDISNELLNQLLKRYQGRAGKGYGIFEDDVDNYPASTILKDYLDENNEDDFLATTERFMNVLKARSETQAGAKGGKVAFIHYEDNSIDYFLVAILSEKIGLMAKDWVITKDDILHIENLRFAGRINLTYWQDDNNDKRYISFLKGQGEISAYFKHFMGCNDALMASKETSKLVACIKNFATEQGLDLDKRAHLNNNAREHLDELVANREQFSMQAFANKLWSDDPQAMIDSFQDYGDTNDFAVSDGFVPDKRSLKGLTVHTHRTKHWRFSFDDDAVSSGHVTVENGKVIFNNPPADIINAYKESTQE